MTRRKKSFESRITPNTPRRIVIVGGGISGLAAAYHLMEANRRNGGSLQISLLEASARLGGSLQTAKRDGFLLEGGPDCFITEKPRGIELARELGLESEIIPTRSEHRRSFIVKGGKLLPVPEGFYLIGPARIAPFLKSPILSWRGKLRVMAEPFAKCSPPPSGDESVASFVRRRLGPEALAWLAQPLLAGIYGADPEALSLKATFPGFLEMEGNGGVLRGLRRRRQNSDFSASSQNDVRKASGARYGLFASFKNGMQTLVDCLAGKLASGGVVIRPNTAVRELRQSPNGLWRLSFSSGDPLEADAVCLALPAYAAADLLVAHDRELADLLESIPYSGSATINLAFRRNDVSHPLDGFGFVVPHAEKRFLLAATFSHQKFEGRAPEGCVLIRGFVGGAAGEHVLKADDATLERRALQDLHDFLGLRDSPLFCVVRKHERSLPQYPVGHVNHLVRIDEKRKKWPGLALAGNWMNGVGIPDCIASGERAAKELVG